MSIPLFDPPVPPSEGTRKRYKPRILKAEFGDGYAQRTIDGINTMEIELQLTWEKLDPWDGDAIIAFFEARGGYEPFEYRPSTDYGHLAPTGNELPWMGGFDSKPMARWICEEWEEELDRNGFKTITATFIRDYGLASWPAP